jgi:hypothetical protein
MDRSALVAKGRGIGLPLGSKRIAKQYAVTVDIWHVVLTRGAGYGSDKDKDRCSEGLHVGFQREGECLAPALMVHT